MLWFIKRSLLFFILIIFLFVDCIADDTDDYSSYQWFMQGKFYYNSKKYQQAYDSFLKALKYNQDNKEAKEFIERIENITKAKKIQLLKQIEEIEVESEKIKNELSQSEKIEVQKETFPWDEFHFNMGKKYFEEKEFDKAEEELLKSLDIVPDNVIANYYLFRIYREKKDFDEICDQIDNISKFIRPYTLWKSLKENDISGDISEVINRIESYFKYFPTLDFDKKFEAELECYKNIKAFEAAIYKYRNLSSMKEFFKNSFKYRIIREFNDYNKNDMVFDMDKLLESGVISRKYECKNGGHYIEHNGRIICTVCDVYEKEPEALEYIEDQKVNITLVDKNMFLKFKKIADNFLENRKFDNAKVNYFEALNYFYDSYDVHNKLGVIYKFEGNLEKAKNEFEKSLSMKFDFIPAFNNLAAVYTQQEDYEKAVITLNKALLIKDADYNLHYNLGLNYEKLGEFNKAEASFTIATLINGNEPDPYIHMAIISKNKGDYDKAIYNLKKVTPLVKNNFELNNMVTEFLDAMYKEKKTK